MSTSTGAEVLTPQEFSAHMRALAVNNTDDPEATHSQADHLMCELLRSLGYVEGVALYEGMERWCA